MRKYHVEMFKFEILKEIS